MRVFLIYLFVVLLWATTPVAIQWSGEGPGFLFGAASRMVIGAACVWLYLLARRARLPWHRSARLTYLAVALQIYGAMMAVYWASTRIPSGWMSVIFGLTPLFTALLSAAWLGEKSLTSGKLLSYALGFAGLAVMFGNALELHEHAAAGIFGVLLSALLQAISSVWVQKLRAGIPADVQVGGGLMVALPLYFATWVVFDGAWPDELTLRNHLAIAYLGLIATPMGFVAYYFILTRLPATQVSLINLVTPVLALGIGHLANGEALTQRLLLGTGLILAALVFHRSTLPGRVRNAPATPPPGRRKRSRRRSSRRNRRSP